MSPAKYQIRHVNDVIFTRSMKTSRKNGHLHRGSARGLLRMNKNNRRIIMALLTEACYVIRTRSEFIIIGFMQHTVLLVTV